MDNKNSLYNLIYNKSGGNASPEVDTTNADNITSGILSNDRLSDNVTLQGNTFNGSGQLVQLSSDSKLPAVDASQLTGILHVTNIIYVDNKRIDEYTPDGSVLKPFKTIQSAHDSIVGNTSTNKFEIKIARGGKYTEVFSYSKDYVMLSSVGLGATLSGDITITSQHPTFVGIDIQSNVNLSLASHFSMNILNCRVTTGTWNITATSPTGDEYIQVFGNDMWFSTLNAVGIKGIVGLSGGIYIGTLNLTNCECQVFGASIQNTINLESGTNAELGGNLASNATINLKTGANLTIDSGSLGGTTIVNTGGNLHRSTGGDDILNDSGITGSSIKDALNVLGNSLKPEPTVKAIAYSDSPYTVQSTDDIIEVDTTGGNVSVVLPSTGIIGSIYKSDTSINTVIITVASGGTIAGLPNFVLQIQGDAYNGRGAVGKWGK